MPGCSTVGNKFTGSLYAGAVPSLERNFVDGEEGGAPFWRGDTGGRSEGGGGDSSRAGNGGRSDGGGGATWLEEAIDEVRDGAIDGVIEGRVWSGEDADGVAPDGMGGSGGKVGRCLGGSPPSCPAIDRPVSWLVAWVDNATRFAGMLAYLLTFRSASVSEPFGRLAPVLPGEGAEVPGRDALPPGGLPATGWAPLADGAGGKGRPPGGEPVAGEALAARSSGARRGEDAEVPDMAEGGAVDGGGGRWNSTGMPDCCTGCTCCDGGALPRSICSRAAPALRGERSRPSPSLKALLP